MNLFADLFDESGIMRERRFFSIQRVYVSPEHMQGLLLEAGFSPTKTKLYGAFDEHAPIDDKSFQDANSPNYLKARQVWICRK